MSSSPSESFWKRCQTEHPLYAAGGTASVLAPSMATTAREDNWPIDGLCIYNYQLATQVENRQVHPSRLDSNRRSDLRLAKPPEKSDKRAVISSRYIDLSTTTERYFIGIFQRTTLP